MEALMLEIYQSDLHFKMLFTKFRSNAILERFRITNI